MNEYLILVDVNTSVIEAIKAMTDHNIGNRDVNEDIKTLKSSKFHFSCFSNS
ncbi:MAG: hypothetical protein ACFFCW_07505 [Candidatus Hodarchaeota archaeon]